VVLRTTLLSKLLLIQRGILAVLLASRHNINGKQLPLGVNISGAEKPHYVLFTIRSYFMALFAFILQWTNSTGKP
jgi:hypothetical protein